MRNARWASDKDARAKKAGHVKPSHAITGSLMTSMVKYLANHSVTQTTLMQ
jgi:hypothetical protein